MTARFTLNTKNFPEFMERLNRNYIGFDEVFTSFFEDTGTVHNPSGYPPYNIEKVEENVYRLTLAAAGFSDENLEITLLDGFLFIDGTKSEDEDREYIYHGIANRSFHREFKLGEHIKVESASMEDGLLTIDLKKEVPEEAKPKSIPIAIKAKVIGSKSKKK